VSATVIDDEYEPSVLVDFDTGYVLDTLSFGIVMLDQQLCIIYANLIAQDLLALHLSGMRGRPLAHFLPQPQRFACAARRALRSGAAVEYTLRVGFERRPRSADSINVRIAPLSNPMSGAYVLVEMSARTCVRFRAAEVSARASAP
jgi:nitrogen-specific signal transduction histidine kinase